MLNIKDLHVGIEGTEIIKGLSLKINPGEIHALMGQNGSGKSTLAQTIMGHPLYSVTEGQITFEEEDLLQMEPNERAKAGIFLSFQYPSEVTGVNVSNYLRLIYNNSHNEKLSPIKFRKLLAERLEILEMSDVYTSRYLNEGFSGGEKKRMEMLQMLVLEPKLIILDEVDSGLDIDAVKIVSNAVNYLAKNNNSSVLVITHYARILNYIEPEFVHIMQKGKLVKQGAKELAHELEEKGYSIIE